MRPRFAGFVPLGSIAVAAGVDETPVAPFTLAPGDNAIWVRVTQLGGQSPWPWGFGLLSFVSSKGRELGTAKVYGHQQGETYRLGNGLAPEDMTGSLVFRPRAYSLAWLKAGNQVWRLSFEARSGSTGPVAGAGSVAVRYPVTDLTQDRSWSLAVPLPLARLNFG